jgi:hypothetical protein
LIVHAVDDRVDGGIALLYAFDRRLEQFGRADAAILNKPGEAKAVIALIVCI